MFDVTYDIVTPESAEYGDFAERGFIDCDVSLRDAVTLVQETRTSRVGGVECVQTDVWPMAGHRVRFVTICNSMEYETGACESRTLHIPETVTAASSRRIAGLLGA